jgi:hypothetical protein
MRGRIRQSMRPGSKSGETTLYFHPIDLYFLLLSMDDRSAIT